jgi:hypothetical protein
VYANDRRVHTHGTDAVSKRRNRDLRVAHVRRCSFQSPDEFCPREDYGR